MDLQKYENIALKQGFSAAAQMPVSELVYVPEYRKYCEDNLCGNYDKLPACPPQSGTVEEMNTHMNSYSTALILQTEIVPEDVKDMAAHRAAKKQHNILTEKLMEQMHEDGISDVLMMGAGPWKTYSCMSAYCVDAQKMADYVHMLCWANDGKVRYFSLLLTK